VWLHDFLSAFAASAIATFLSHNLFMQQVFTPLTSDTGITKHIAGDLGAAFVVVALMVAYIFWRKRGELPVAGTVPAGAALASLR
jgi:uncharacterized membrane protein YhhN